MKENLSKKSWNFDPTQNSVKCPKLIREAPRATQKIKKKLGPKGPWAQFGAQGRRHEAAALEISANGPSPVRTSDKTKSCTAVSSFMTSFFISSNKFGSSCKDSLAAEKQQVLE